MMKKLRAILAIIMIVTMISACQSSSGNVPVSGNEQDSNTTQQGDMSTDDKETTEEPTTEEPTTEEPTTTEPPYEPITMAFVGDVYLGDTLYGYYQKSGLTGFMGQSILDIFQSVDIMVANHEYVATDLPESAKDTFQLYNFKAPVAREVLWDEMGVDIVSLANNHAMDYGQQSLIDCVEALDKLNVNYIGAGRNRAEALKAQIIEINGKKIAIMAACRFVPTYQWYAQENKPGLMATYESTKEFGIVKDEIKRLKEEEKCDIVAVYVHFGKEKSYEIIKSQKVVAHGYVDSGADLVIGSHAHNLQGIEIYKDAPIYYNLGNFLFSWYQVDTMVVQITINEDNSLSTKIVPCDSRKFTVKEVSGKEAKDIIDFVESISVNVEIDDEGNVTEKGKMTETEPEQPESTSEKVSENVE